MNDVKKSKIYNVIILDKSGSMSSIRKQAVDGVNETLGGIRSSAKSAPETEQYVTLVAFCGCELKTIIDTQKIDNVKNITQEQYVPCCMTPLYDAVGSTITKLHKLMEDTPASAASVTIITDGYENASREFSFKAVKALIEAYKSEGWLFAYIGADHDVESVAYSLSIDNALRFDKSDEGVHRMTERSNASRARWSERVSFCLRESLASPTTNAQLSSKLSEINDDYFVDK